MVNHNKTMIHFSKEIKQLNRLKLLITSPHKNQQVNVYVSSYTSTSLLNPQPLPTVCILQTETDHYSDPHHGHWPYHEAHTDRETARLGYRGVNLVSECLFWPPTTSPAVLHRLHLLRGFSAHANKWELPHIIYNSLSNTPALGNPLVPPYLSS